MTALDGLPAPFALVEFGKQIGEFAAMVSVVEELGHCVHRWH